MTVDGSGPLPAAVVFDAVVPSPDPLTPSCSIEFECYEGMLVEIADGSVTGPNQRFGSDPVAEVHITAASARTFREPGIQFPSAFPLLPEWDGNPEVFELDADKLIAANAGLTIAAGSSFSATGVLGFEFGGYELWPTELSVSPAPLPVAVRPRGDAEFTVGSLNVFRLFDDVDDPAVDGRNDAVVSAAEYARRRAKLADYIVNVLDAPDVLAVQEAEKLGVLEDLAADIAALDPSVSYAAFLVEGNDIGTIDTGFLVRDTVQVDAITQLEKDDDLHRSVRRQRRHPPRPAAAAPRGQLSDRVRSDADHRARAAQPLAGRHQRQSGSAGQAEALRAGPVGRTDRSGPANGGSRGSPGRDSAI